MAPTLYRDTGFSLTHLIEDIKRGNIALPCRRHVKTDPVSEHEN